jgi:hypothetical protein
MTDVEIVSRIGSRPELKRDLSNARAIATWELARAMLYPDPGPRLRYRDVPRGRK